MNKPTVWVVKEQVRRDATGPVPMDYSPAYKFGDVKFITDFDLPIHGKGTLGPQWYAKVVEFIKSFDDEQDYIILTGSPLAMFLVGAMLGNACKCPKILVWRRESNEYIEYDPVPHMTEAVGLIAQ